MDTRVLQQKYANEMLPNILSPTPTDRQESVTNQVNWLMCSIESHCSFSKLLVFKALLLSLIIVDKFRDATKRYYWEVWNHTNKPLVKSRAPKLRASQSMSMPRPSSSSTRSWFGSCCSLLSESSTKVLVLRMLRWHRYGQDSLFGSPAILTFCWRHFLWNVWPQGSASSSHSSPSAFKADLQKMHCRSSS